LTITINVPATQPWADTGIDLSVGAHVTITATGSISPCGNCGSSGPDGLPGAVPEQYVAPGLNFYCLVGRIGNGVPTKVGTGVSFVAPIAGRLGIGINDSAFNDNSGSYAVTITVR
jgi:hypothetical protein